MKRAFSLVELIVVIGIIGVLAGVLFASFSGGTESARAAKCLSNMRNLAQAAISTATNGRKLTWDTSYHYPLAGSRAVLSDVIRAARSRISRTSAGSAGCRRTIPTTCTGKAAGKSGRRALSR